MTDPKFYYRKNMQENEIEKIGPKRKLILRKGRKYSVLGFFCYKKFFKKNIDSNIKNKINRL